MGENKYYIKFNYINGGHSEFYFDAEDDLNDAFEQLKDGINDCKYVFFGNTLVNVDNVLAIEICVE